MDARTTLLEHISSIRFEEGVDRGKWGIADDLQFPLWPFVIFWVQANLDGLRKYHIRFDLTDYPSIGPAGRLWNFESQSFLSQVDYPKGGQCIDTVFHSQPQKIYAPCDRENGHSEWRNNPQFGEFYWNDGFTIVDYLKFMHYVLKSAS